MADVFNVCGSECIIWVGIIMSMTIGWELKMKILVYLSGQIDGVDMLELFIVLKKLTEVIYDI